MAGLLRRGRLLLAVALFFCLPVLGASAAPPPGSYFQGFEQNKQGWYDYSGATVNRVMSGSMSSYANGAPASDGNWYARLGKDPSPATCASGGGPQPWYVGPYTDFGGDTSGFFPPGGYTTGVDIYLDVAWAQTHLDQRFDWSSEINDTTGGFRRDFVFNAGTTPAGFVISASNNGNRCSSFPANPGRTPVLVTVSGWYTFKHTFTGVPGGPLVVNLQLIQKATGIVVGTWVLSDPSDIIGVTVGGNSDGWFVQNEINDLPIDNTFRTGIVSTPGCDIKISDGGSITTLSTDQATFGGNAKVSSSGDSTGQQTYHDHGPVTPLDFKALTVQAVVCSDDRTSADIYGTGTVDGAGQYEYRIRLTDNGEPGSDDVYGITIPGAGYASGDQKLDGGNIQIR
jgi:hypothetical protein